MYGSYGIQQEGRASQVGQEAGSRQVKPSKRPRKKSGAFIGCKECGEQFQLWHRSDPATCCSPACGYAAARRITDERAKCLACHALVGMTATASGKMVNVSHTVIGLERKKRGIQGGGYALAAVVGTMKRMANPRIPPKEVADRLATKQWMDDEWGGFTECYWAKMSKSHIDRISMMGDGIDVSGISSNMLWYYMNHKESKSKMAKYALERYHKSKGDEIAIVRRKLRNHIHRVCRLSGSKKQRKTIEYLGCTIPEARAYLQKQFKRGMKWENHGEMWEIDHIVPMSHFNLMDESHRMRVNHFTNLQPLFKAENRMKSDRLLVNHQLALI